MSHLLGSSMRSQHESRHGLWPRELSGARRPGVKSWDPRNGIRWRRSVGTPVAPNTALVGRGQPLPPSIRPISRRPSAIATRVKEWDMTVAFQEWGHVVVIKPDHAVYEGGDC